MSAFRIPATQSDPIHPAARACIVLLALLFTPGQTVALEAGDRTLVVGVESGIRGFDPIQARVMGESTVTAAMSMYDTLIDLGDDGGIEPRLARSLTLSEDRREWTAELRQDVRFHDGTPFDADAVVFHFERLMNPANRCPCRVILSPIESVSARDPHAVVFKLKRPWAAFPAAIAEPSVVSLIGSPSAIRDSAEAYHRHPVGTGPFRFRRWLRGDRLEVERNPDYWRAEALKLDGIVFRVLPDQQTRAAAVQAGDVHVIWTLRAQSVLNARRDEQLRVHERVGTGARIFVFNTSVPPLDDVRVRRALVQAFDADAFVRVVHRGLTPTATDPYGPSAPFRCEDTAYAEYDPDRARSLLADYGKPVAVELLHTPTPRGRESAQLLHQFWSAVGVEVRLAPVEQVQLLQRVLTRKYQVGAWRIRDSKDPDIDLFGLFHSASPFNIAGYRSPQADRLLVAAREAEDWATRAPLYCKLARRLNEDAPILYASRNTYFVIARREVRGPVRVDGGILDVTRTWLEP